MLKKSSLREQIRDFLIEEIRLGNLTSGQKLSLAEFGRKLGVSVTPVREALTQLEQSGIIEARQNMGFFIRELHIEEAKDIYSTIGFIEGMAVSGLSYTKKEVNELKRLQKEMNEKTNPLEKLKKDHQFHQVLIKEYPNEQLKNIVENLKAAVYINELEFMRSGLSKESNLTHLKIIEHIENANLQKASKELEDHWSLSYQFLKNINDEK